MTAVTAGSAYYLDREPRPLAEVMAEREAAAKAAGKEMCPRCGMAFTIADPPCANTERSICDCGRNFWTVTRGNRVHCGIEPQRRMPV